MSRFEEALLVWLLHMLGWFLFSALCSVCRGQWKAVSLRYCFPMGTVSAGWQFMLAYYGRQKGFW